MIFSLVPCSSVLLGKHNILIFQISIYLGKIRYNKDLHGKCISNMQQFEPYACFLTGLTTISHIHKLTPEGPAAYKQPFNSMSVVNNNLIA